MKHFRMVLPFINLNGTSKAALFEEKRELFDKTSELLTLLENHGPHGRDYLQGGGTGEDWLMARNEHSNRINMIRDLNAILLEEMVKIDQL